MYKGHAHGLHKMLIVGPVGWEGGIRSSGSFPYIDSLQALNPKSSISGLSPGFGR